MNCSTWEISQAGLSRWVPVRAKQRGAKPGVTGAGVLGPHKEKNDGMWKFTRFEITPEVKKKLLAKGLEVAVKVMYNTHLYTFRGKVYHQQSGAPIGERGSVGTCRIILNFVDREVQEKLVAIKNAPILAFWYLDDVRKMLKRIKLGCRWVRGSMVYKRAWEQEEAAAGLTPTQKTAINLTPPPARSASAGAPKIAPARPHSK